MALVVEDGSAKTDAESYISVSDADTYVSDWHGSVSEWDNASQAEKERALRHGTRYVDNRPFYGEPTSTRQALAWPRLGLDIYRHNHAAAVSGPINGKTFASDEVPADIKNATVEAALRHVQGDALFPVHDGGTIKRESKKVASVSKDVEFAAPRTAGKTFEAIEALLRPYSPSPSRRLERV